MKRRIEQKPSSSIRGYLEGYYGKLLSWRERSELIEYLSTQRMNTYCYAPKEDVKHRLRWREPHDQQWHQSFAQFCQFAEKQNVSITAGIAPGLDFNFDRQTNNSDFQRLRKKAHDFLDDGTNDILILWDDIDEGNFVENNSLSEGAAHARVINELSESLGRPLWTVPRVYAEEIEDNNGYLESFFAELQPQHTVLLCGKAIVASNVSDDDLVSLSRTPNTISKPGSSVKPQTKHRTLLWDNFYANDYCPRRLFVGPWTGREHITEYLLNPTGLPHTDRLLLDIALSTHTSTNAHIDWMQALKRHRVPDAFQAIAPYFSAPFFGDISITEDTDVINCITPTNKTEQAIEICLWKWKSPLAREWYPFIMSLKHDLALMKNTLPKDRVLKTQPPALAKKLLN